MKDSVKFHRLTFVPTKSTDSGVGSHHPAQGVANSPANLSFERARDRMKQLTPSERLRLEKLLNEKRAADRKTSRKKASIIPFATEGSA
jgi:hypothetical protein